MELKSWNDVFMVWLKDELTDGKQMLGLVVVQTREIQNFWEHFAPLVDSATADSAAFSMAPASLAIAAQIWGDQAASTEGS